MFDRRFRQSGTTLIEPLIAFLILALGVLAVSRVQGHLRLSADTARQRGEAVRLAQEDLEHLRASVAAGGSGASIERTIAPQAGLGNTRYSLSRKISASGSSRATHVTVGVAWTEHAGAPQQVTLVSVIAGTDSALSGALGLAPRSASVNAPFGRSIRIPFGAMDLGNGTSAFRPVAGDTMVFIYANASGALTSRCRLSSAGATDLRAAQLDCSPVTTNDSANTPAQS